MRRIKSSLTRAFGLSVIAASLASTPVIAQTLAKPGKFPERPVTVYVPYGPGGGSDQLSRAWAEAMQPVLGIGMQVVNRPGGGGMAAIPDFMSAPKDGYTILQSIDDAITNYASGKLKEHPAKDWTPLCMTQITFSQLYVRTDDDRFSSFDALVKFARANPEKVTVANVGNLGSMERVTMNMLETGLKFKTRQIAFDKPSERYAALIGGQVDVLFEQPGDVRNFIEAKQIKPIFTFLKERPKVFAYAPSLNDVKEVDFEPLLRFRGFWVHKDVPQDRTKYLAAACKAAFNSKSYAEFNEKKYMHLIDSFRDTEGSKKLINNSIDIYTKVYKEIGLIK
jgi:tripartite-type tricarboxylate transporter receptor subunit TctC